MCCSSSSEALEEVLEGDSDEDTDICEDTSSSEEEEGEGEEEEMEVTARPTLSLGGGFKWDSGTSGNLEGVAEASSSGDEEIEDAEVTCMCSFDVCASHVTIMHLSSKMHVLVSCDMYLTCDMHVISSFDMHVHVVQYAFDMCLSCDLHVPVLDDLTCDMDVLVM